jgi:thiol-disulfide isomerase/thioredoxin
MTQKLITIIAACLLFGYTAQAQGYRIDVLIDDAKDSTVYLAVYSGEGKYARDTARTNKKGQAVFAKNKSLAGGMYMLVAGGIQLCEFLISDEQSQKFDIHYKKNGSKPVEIVYNNSPENTAFAAFQKYMGQRQLAGRRLREKAQKDTTFRTVAIDSLTIIADEEKEYTGAVADQWKGKLLGSLAKSMQALPPAPEPDVPQDHPKRDSILWAYYYQWDKLHFFDHVDFSDARLLNTPLFEPNFNFYFTKKIIQHPDSVISAIHPVLEKARANQDMFMFCLGHLFNTYIQWKMLTITPDYAIGMEAVVMELIQNYYLTGDAEWAQKDTTFMKQIRDYVRFNKHSLVGLKAPELKMQSLTGQDVSLYDLKSPYTLLLFFDTNCGHCKKEIPLIYDIYNKYKNDNLQAFCVYIEKNGIEWQKFVEEQEWDWINVWDPYETTHFRELYTVQTTPQIYLLNKDKTIIARRVTHELLEQLLTFYIDKKTIDKTEL